MVYYTLLGNGPNPQTKVTRKSELMAISPRLRGLAPTLSWRASMHIRPQTHASFLSKHEGKVHSNCLNMSKTFVSLLCAIVSRPRDGATRRVVWQSHVLDTRERPIEQDPDRTLPLGLFSPDYAPRPQLSPLKTLYQGPKDQGCDLMIEGQHPLFGYLHFVSSSQAHRNR